MSSRLPYIGQEVLYVTKDTMAAIPKIVHSIEDESRIGLLIDGQIITATFSDANLPGTWHFDTPILKRNQIKSYQVPCLIEGNPLNLSQDNPKSPDFELPEFKKPVWGLAAYWEKYAGTGTIQSQLRPAKELIRILGLEKSIRVVRLYAPKKWTIWGMLRNLSQIQEEFGWRNI